MRNEISRRTLILKYDCPFCGTTEQEYDVASYEMNAILSNCGVRVSANVRCYSCGENLDVEIVDIGF